jgi:flagellar biosynthesis protein FlhB
MADEDQSSKTEDATPKKLAHSRNEGSVAQSQEIRSWMILLGGGIGLVLMFPGIMHDVRMIGARFIETPDTVPFDVEHLRLVLVNVLVDLAISLGPLTAVLLVMAVMSSVGQFGWLFAPKKIAPKLTKISVLAGVKRLFSMRSVVEFVKGIAKLVVVTVVAMAMTMPILQDLAVLPDMDLVQTLERLYAIAIRLVLGTLAVMTVIAVLDFFYQQQSFLTQQRMTPHEVKDEHRQAEGDPQVKARIRRLRNERAQQRMMAAVPTADVVITNPTHYAVALTYDMSSMQAPKLVAKGIDHIAMRIREVAEENDVPIMENPPVARALYAAVELDEEIPPEHYKAVAEIIGYVMRLRGDLPSNT